MYFDAFEIKYLMNDLILRDLGPWRIHPRAHYTDMMAEKIVTIESNIFNIFRK